MKLLASAILTLFSLNAFSIDGWTGETTVDSIRVYTSEYVLITMDTTHNPSNCTDTDYLMLEDANSDTGKRKYSTLLAAYAAKSTVNIGMTGCSGEGTSGYRIIDQIWVK